MKRRRAPGGGRKPKSGAVAARSVTVRMPEKVFRDLEAALRRHPNQRRTLTDEIVGRLRASISREREHQHDPALRAWRFLISEVADFAHYQTPDWHKNPFWFRAFKLAVMGLLDALEPMGEIQPPENLGETPEAQAKYAVRAVLHNLRGGAGFTRAIGLGLSPEDRDQAAARFLSDPEFPDLEFDRETYAHARRDLQLMPPIR
jgi:hypothetical protein